MISFFTCSNYIPVERSEHIQRGIAVLISNVTGCFDSEIINRSYDADFAISGRLLIEIKAGSLIVF